MDPSFRQLGYWALLFNCTKLVSEFLGAEMGVLSILSVTDQDSKFGGIEYPD